MNLSKELVPTQQLAVTGAHRDFIHGETHMFILEGGEEGIHAVGITANMWPHTRDLHALGITLVYSILPIASLS